MRIIAATILLALAITGCTRAPQVQRASLPDRYYVAEAALHYMLDPHSGSGAERNGLSAHVIERSEFTTQLLASFRGYRPTVITNTQVSTEGGFAHDKITGKAVMLWTVQVKEIHGDSAVAYVTWYSGNLAAGGHTIQLHRKAGRWVVVSERMDWIS